MLNYNSPINDTKNYSDLKISEIEPTIKINLRSKKRDFFTKAKKFPRSRSLSWSNSKKCL